MTDPILENAFIERLARYFPRSPIQLNGLQEADAELIRLPGSDTILALKTDCLVEEIETGLYADPYLIGWMAVVVNGSDLAAVGATPVGMLLSETLPPDADHAYLERLQEGIRDACGACGLQVFGGDTNFSAHVQLGAFALGTIPAGAQITRLGARPGDRVFTSGPLGSGSVFGFSRLAPGGSGSGPAYRPLPRLREGQLLRGFAACCMDTSDGGLATLDQLARLNRVGFDLDAPWEAILDPSAVTLAHGQSFPEWVMLAGPHGEFELVFTVPQGKQAAFLDHTRAHEWEPVPLGVVTERPSIVVRRDGRPVTLDTGAVRNLFVEVGGDVRRFIAELRRMDAALGAAGSA